MALCLHFQPFSVSSVSLWFHPSMPLDRPDQLQSEVRLAEVMSGAGWSGGGGGGVTSAMGCGQRGVEVENACVVGRTRRGVELTLRSGGGAT
jgi:hypothetical protein